MLSSLSHIALLVPSVESAARFLNSKGIQCEQPEVFEAEGTKEIYVGNYQSQRSLLLLVEAISEGPYQRALRKRGPSLHHIGIDVKDLQSFLKQAESSGWSRHSINATTISKNGTAWLYAKGIPTLIEVTERKQLSTKPPKISRLELTIGKDRLDLFSAIELEGFVFPSHSLCFTVDGHRLAFAELI